MSMALSRRYYSPTFKRPPSPNWSAGIQAAMRELYSTDPVPADEVARLEREHAAVPYRREPQGDLALTLPERPHE